MCFVLQMGRPGSSKHWGQISNINKSRGRDAPVQFDRRNNSIQKFAGNLAKGVGSRWLEAAGTSIAGPAAGAAAGQIPELIDNVWGGVSDHEMAEAAEGMGEGVAEAPSNQDVLAQRVVSRQTRATGADNSGTNERNAAIMGHGGTALPQDHWWLPRKRIVNGTYATSCPVTMQLKAWKQDIYKLPNMVTGGLVYQYDSSSTHGVNRFSAMLYNMLNDQMVAFLADNGYFNEFATERKSMKGASNLKLRLKRCTFDMRRFRNPEVELNKVSTWRDNIRIIVQSGWDTAPPRESTYKGFTGREILFNNDDDATQLHFVSTQDTNLFLSTRFEEEQCINVGMDTPFQFDMMPRTVNNKQMQQRDDTANGHPSKVRSYTNVTDRSHPMDDWYGIGEFMNFESGTGSAINSLDEPTIWDCAHPKVIFFSLFDDMWPQDISGSQTATTVYIDGRCNVEVEYMNMNYSMGVTTIKNQMA